MNSESMKDKLEAEGADWVWYERPGALRNAREFGKLLETVLAEAAAEKAAKAAANGETVPDETAKEQQAAQRASFNWGWYERPGAFPSALQ
ncbi:MAG: hypothetical protein HOP19_16190 [Acidobacteria bacterium]|nr:hypothetical protein [Acidobacteriota bacterium]